MTLVEYALSDLSRELDNFQCRSLLTDQSIGINNFSEKFFNQAIENLLKHFISFGLVEEFDKSLLLFRRELGWSDYPFYVKLNSKPDYFDKNISSEVRTKIAERNYWDVRLYNWVKDEFKRKLQKVSNLEEELKVLHVSSDAFKKGMDHGIIKAYEKEQRNKKGIKGYVMNLLGR